tara:strand:- start:167 stop:481 length:315 start_codon:yes stop_codon:yes gene_type:complete
MDAPRRRRRKTVPNYNSYIQKAMKNIGTHDTTISSKAVQMINLIVKDLEKRLSTSAAALAKYEGKSTLNSKHVRTAVSNAFAGDLQEFAVQNVDEALRKYCLAN